MKNELKYKTPDELLKEVEELRFQLNEANDTIEAIRTGQIDALVVQGDEGHQLYTLKSADHTYRLFIEKMTEGAVTLNTQGVILYSNSQFASMINRSLSQVIGMHFEDVVAEENRHFYNELFNRCWTGDCKGEVMLLAGEGRRPVQLSLTTLELDEGVSLSIILTDLTNQKKAQQQLMENNQKLEESNHDLQQFASIASHDLQEPLRKIQIFSDLLLAKNGELSPESGRHLQKIISSSVRMKTLIIDILNYSRLSARDDRKECIDLNDIVSELTEDFELIIAEKKASLVNQGLPCIYVNKGQIRQVFQNIISNALKFSREGVPPVITIQSERIREKSFETTVQPDGPFVLITINDNGIGFDEKYVSNIFSLFERLNGKDQYEGTGIGLAIAKKIIEKHQGLITAYSKEGSGSSFRIILPVASNSTAGL